jgi:hypothetical protein
MDLLVHAIGSGLTRAKANLEPSQTRYRVRVPLRHFEARTTGLLTCCLAQEDLRRGPTDFPAFTPLTPAVLGPL